MREILCLLVGLSIQVSIAYFTTPCQELSQYEQALGGYALRPFRILKNNGPTQVVDYDLSEWLKQEQFLLLIPFEGKEHLLELRQYHIYNNSKVARKPMRHYRGSIVGDMDSHVQISMSDNHISGKIKGTEIDLVIQPHQNKGQLEFFNTKSRKSPKWECNASTMEGYYEQLDRLPFNNKYEKNNTKDTVTIYIEVDHHVYSIHNDSENAAQNYTESLLAAVADLYYQEDIVLLYTDINLWTIPTPYSENNSIEAISDFKEQLGTSYGADLAHLISGNPLHLGGVAYLNGICNKNKSYGYSNIHGDYNGGYSYHWDVHVIAHELGHNLGSPHTHDCVWGPNNNMSLDACVNKGCGGSVPETGGTIMSYCHQSEVGINFNKGFGYEPSNLMKSVLSICINDLPKTCESSTELLASGVYTTHQLSDGFGATEGSAQHAAWYTFTAIKDGYISGGSCEMGVDTRLFIYEGNCENLIIIDQSDDNCHSSNGLLYASSFDSIPINEGRTYFLEWDDRWSSESFDFTFEVAYNNIDHCYNNIQDGDEIGVDCGGSSCMPCCTSNEELSNIVMENTTLITNQELNVGSKIMAPSSVIICSGTTIEFEAGFELETGAELLAQIEDCMN